MAQSEVIFVSIETATALWVVMHNLLSAAIHFFLAAIPLWGSVPGHYMYALIMSLLLMFNQFVAWKPQLPTTYMGA